MRQYVQVRVAINWATFQSGPELSGPKPYACIKPKYKSIRLGILNSDAENWPLTLHPFRALALVKKLTIQ
jgi:hypothetical protein